MQAIATRNLAKSYWFYEKGAGITGSIRALFSAKRRAVEAVRGIDIDIALGEIVGLIGPNGAGKTTTLKMLTGILHPSSGSARVLGFVPHRREKQFLRSITLVTGQRNRLFWDLPAAEYFKFCQVIYEIPQDDYQRSAAELIALAEIEPLLRVPQRKLSTGQRKRCELAAALLHRPRIIFLDEPTNGLDVVSAARIREFIKSRGQAGDCTLLLTSHNMIDIAQVCDRLLILNHGRIVYDGSLGNLMTRTLRKRIRVVFRNGRPAESFSCLGRVVAQTDYEIQLEVQTDSAPAVIAQILDRYAVADVEVRDPPLEEVIRAVYQQNPIGPARN